MFWTQAYDKSWQSADPLTGLASAGEFLLGVDGLTGPPEGSSPGDGSAAGSSVGALAMLDLDRLKQVNLDHGHHVGDEVIQAYAQGLRTATEQLHPGALLARLGGDELGVVVPGMVADELADVLRGALPRGRPISTSAGPLPVTCSAGVTVLVAGELSSHAMSRADVALLHAKSTGRNSVVQFGSATQRFAAERQDLLEHISQLRTRLAQLGAEVRTDPLTSIGNRRALDEWLTRFDHAQQRAEQPAAVLFIDLDRLHVFNHTYGQEAGDTALRAVARVLASTCRAGDLLFRRGGDEFVALLPGCSPAEGAAVAERIRARVEALADHPDSSHDLTSLTTTVVVADVPAGIPAAASIEVAARTAFAAKEGHSRNSVLLAFPG